jgi:hypothetical protein
VALLIAKLFVLLLLLLTGVLCGFGVGVASLFGVALFSIINLIGGASTLSCSFLDGWITNCSSVVCVPPLLNPSHARCFELVPGVSTVYLLALFLCCSMAENFTGPLPFIGGGGGGT